MTIHDIALGEALAHFLYEAPWDEMTYDEIYERIQNNEMEGILVWRPFEYFDHGGLTELIDLFYDQRVAGYRQVIGKIKDHLVNLAIADRLPLDMNELDFSFLFRSDELPE